MHHHYIPPSTATDAMETTGSQNLHEMLHDAKVGRSIYSSITAASLSFACMLLTDIALTEQDSGLRLTHIHAIVEVDYRLQMLRFDMEAFEFSTWTWFKSTPEGENQIPKDKFGLQGSPKEALGPMWPAPPSLQWRHPDYWGYLLLYPGTAAAK
eukprot:scaffold137430_cov61-Attheya_sp.AAC.1